MAPPPRIAVHPPSAELTKAVLDGGGALVDLEEADGLVWTDPYEPEALREALHRSKARWVQLPFAGIEDFFAAGAIVPGRTWTCAKAIYGPACAEHALLLMLSAARRMHEHLPRKSWRRPSREEVQLEGATALVIGAGGIAGALAPILAALRMRVWVVSRSGGSVSGATRAEAMGALPALLPEADYVVIAAALTPETANTFNTETLSRMKRSAWLVNVARGGWVDIEALVEALTSGAIGGAALDVTSPEPLPDGHPLWSAPNAIITPHIANTAAMRWGPLVELVKRNVGHFARGEMLEGLVDPATGY